MIWSCRRAHVSVCNLVIDDNKKVVFKHMRMYIYMAIMYLNKGIGDSSSVVYMATIPI